MKKLFLFFIAASSLFLLSACEDYSCDGIQQCANYGPVTDCTTYGNRTSCTTRESCTNYVCCEYLPGGGRGCSGESCGKTCFSAVPLRKTVLDQLLGSSRQQLTIKDITIDKVVTAAANADLGFMERMGLSSRDLQSVAQNQTLSAAAVQKMANALQESPAMAEQVAGDIAQAFQTQRTQLQSSYWQTCMNSGTWTTDKNLFCRSTRWTGCSPEQGATLCLSEVGLKRLKSIR